jgi:alanyl-tRNA synthetase
VDGSLEVGQEVIASIDGRRRDAIRRNHTATHLLHWALREVLGEHVRQQGSLVAPNRLRFDFSHHAAPTQDELDAVTTLVNEQIISDESVETTETSRSDAEEMGAIAFFGDKYGESVRVVKAGSRSLEFCGGTHVASLGQIGSLQIISEGSIGSNTRRIEAVTALESVKVSLAHAASLREVGSILKAEPDQVLDALNRSLARTKEVERERDGLRRAQMERDAEVLLDQAADGILVARVQDRGADDLRQMAGALLKRGGLEVAALGSVLDGKASVAVASDDQRDAREIVKEVGGLIGGGGGGSPQLAVAGGKELGGLDDALAAVRTLLSTP